MPNPSHYEVSCLPTERSDCPLLESFSIGNACFTSSVKVAVVNCNSLSEITFGFMAFCNVSLWKMNMLPALKNVAFSPFAFYHCNELDIQSKCGASYSIDTRPFHLLCSSLDHFKDIQMIRMSS